MKNQTNLMVGLIAQTSIHAGAGSSAGAVDLPIQREGHNGWPCIFGSSVKGALRTKAEQVLTASDSKRDDATLNTIFGPDTQNASDHAGAISVGDARLLLLPVRSLTSAFKWVTCPAALDRFKRDSAMLGKNLTFKTPEVPKNDNHETALCTTGENLFLEEYRFTVDSSTNLDAVINALCDLVKRDGFAEALKEQLAIVSNNMFAHLARSATPVNAHIALKDDGSKTVAKGALWYEETLPPETVLYIPIMAQKSRKAGDNTDSSAIANFVQAILGNGWLQVGGNETVGMGWCAVHVETIGGQ